MKYTSISLIPNISNTANHITFHSRNLIPLFKALSPRWKFCMALLMKNNTYSHLFIAKRPNTFYI